MPDEQHQFGGLHEQRFVWRGTSFCGKYAGRAGDSIPVQELERAVGTGIEYGLVGYTHAAGVDRPLVAWKGAEV